MTKSKTDPEADAKVLVSKLQRLSQRIIGLSTAGDAARTTNDENLTFESRLESNEKDLENFDEAWDQLEAVTIKADKSFPDAELKQLYDSVHDEVIQGKAIHKRIQRQRRNAGPLPGAAPDANATITVQSSARAHLPKISIPQFSGDILKWSHFKDLFTSLIHDEPSLTNVEKLHYLQSSLKGEALSLISSFPIEDGSYLQAWEKLCNVYGNPRVLGTILIQKIVEFKTNPHRNEADLHERFLIEVADNIQAFIALKLANPADFILASLALRALDPNTRRQFELTLKSDDQPPKPDDVINFVRQRKVALKMSEQLSTGSSGSPQFISTKPKYPSRTSPRYSGVTLHSCSEYPANSSSSQQSCNGDHNTPDSECKPRNRSNIQCPQCRDSHHLSRCAPFQRLDPTKRLEALKGKRICMNCLASGHFIRDCRSKFSCRKCKRRHHTLLHVDTKEQAPAQRPKTVIQPKQDKADSQQQGSSFIGFGSSTVSASKPSMVLLGTVRTLVKGRRGDFHSVRAVLDSGSQQSFVTSSLARRMGAEVLPFKGSITSLAESTVPQSHLKGVTTCCIQPCDGSRQLETHSVVVDRITSALPGNDLSPHIIDSLRHQPLADYEFCESAPVELLIGGDLYPQVITGAPTPAGVDGIFLTPSIFGLVVTGRVQGETEANTFTLFMESHSKIEQQLKAFWDLEEPAQVDRTHPEDALCEEHFLQTHSRNAEGRYIVRLPIRGTFAELGSNREQALKRFFALEQKLRRDSMLNLKYSEFMQEYLDLKHMSHAIGEASYLIPHHGVWQESNQGRKLRVVFDASCPSSNGSLNEALLAGPKLQKDLSEVLIRFRLYAIPLCADLVKMYRQILIHTEDRHLQRILWRSNPEEVVKEFQLNTVTYGVKSSAYQALRVVKQLVIDEGTNFPLAADRISTDMYVDDIVSGADTIEEALRLQTQLRELFAKGGFSLGKWASTDPQLLPSPEESVQSVSLLPSNEECVKILGMTWNSSSDSFSFSINQPPYANVTKRQMLSCTARAFDPLGLLAPVIFRAKTLIQEVWKAGIDWDDELPQHLQHEWSELTHEWVLLSTLSIPRYISTDHPTLHIVGFCDASTKGYSAALYLRAEDNHGDVKVSLIKAKTKVAPLKFVSISRLELCGALLLSRLISSIPQHLSENLICFTDSQVALTWINTPQHQLKVFEANRVSQIINVIPAKFWRHVGTEDNPADLASRGCTPRTLQKDPLWWSGPAWLKTPVSNWFQPREESVILTNVTPTASPSSPHDWIATFSSYVSLIRTVARILRWRPPSSSCPRATPSGAISAAEFAEAETRVQLFTQRSEFPKELFGSSCPPSFSHLSPFSDDRGILRVGGRLQNSSLEFSAKHPILVPPKSWLARLIVEHIHRSNFHAGPTLTLSLLRSRYWIPRAPKLIRSCLIRCVHCRLSKAKPEHPIMSSLPKDRFHEVRAFLQVGVDYAGPFLIKESKRRNSKVSKAYLCLFVCLSSKALHLELVSSLSTPAFLAALERFMSRRGAPTTMWSDHGTNFIGASRFLKDLYKFHRDIEADIVEHIAPKGINWKHIPPRAPHFGGIWEAGVKSVKTLLANSIGKQPATFEELTTTLCKIEALLNSRPLCQLSEDVENFDFLTPGHFLIGSSLSSLPGPSGQYFKDLPPSSRWEMTQERIAHIWERWRKEYLHSLQQRTKWTRSVPGIQTGELVILLEKRSTIGVWPVGRVTKIFPGRDNVTRVVEVRTPSGKTLTRAASSVVPLFHPDSQENTAKGSM